MHEKMRGRSGNARNASGSSRRRFLAFSARAAAAIGVGPAAQELSAQTSALGALDETTTVLVNGKIHTIDGANTVANSVTIRHNRIVAVGGAVSKAGAGVRIIDLVMQTGSIAEWAAPPASGAVWREAQRLVGQAG